MLVFQALCHNMINKRRIVNLMKLKRVFLIEPRRMLYSLRESNKKGLKLRKQKKKDLTNLLKTR